MKTFTRIQLALAISIAIVSCKRCSVINVPSNNQWGGRTISISVHPSNANVVWAASESGGFFVTTDGGRLWKHIDSLPFRTSDIKICPGNPNIIIATTKTDSRARNRSGIWVSRDGGKRWKQPASTFPVVLAGSNPFIEAYGIGFAPVGGRVYVGTSLGICMSEDTGKVWEFINPESSGGAMPIYAVLPVQGGKVYIYGQSGIKYSADGKTNWTQDLTRMGGGWNIPDALAVSPLNSEHVFFTNGWNSLWYSTNGGQNFRNIQPDSGWYDGRQPYVKVGRPLSGAASEIDLYYSNRSIVARKAVRWNGRDYDFSGAWNRLPFQHSDPADLEFAADGSKPIYASNDGGVEKSTDNGSNWASITNPANFYNALQIFNVKGTFYTGSPRRLDLYFGTQDNSFWASGDGGNTWPYGLGQEGFGIQGPASYNSSSDSAIHLVNIGGCSWRRTAPHYRNEECMAIPRPDTIPTSAPTFVKDKIYIVFAHSRKEDPNSNLWISNDEGRSWTRTGVTVTNPLFNYVTVAGSGVNTTIFAPCIVSGDFNAGSAVFGLYRITNVFNGRSGDEVVRLVNLPAGANMGVVTNEWAWHPSYSVDPSNPNYIIFPDVANNNIAYTTDGGTRWNTMPGLHNMVTEGGALRFFPSQNWPQVREVVFDPRNTNRMLLGTYEAGVFFSENHGASWCKIPGSEQVHQVSSFFFLNDTMAYASTYGRGLWKLRLCAPGPADPVLIPGDGGNGTTVPGGGRGVTGLTGAMDVPNPAYHSGPQLHVSTAFFGNVIPVQHSGESFEISGSNWLPASKSDGKFRITLDDRELEVKIRVDEKGNFTAKIPSIEMPGLHEIVVMQMGENQKYTERRLQIYVKVRERFKGD